MKSFRTLWDSCRGRLELVLSRKEEHQEQLFAVGQELLPLLFGRGLPVDDPEDKLFLGAGKRYFIALDHALLLVCDDDLQESTGLSVQDVSEEGCKWAWRNIEEIIIDQFGVEWDVHDFEEMAAIGEFPPGVYYQLGIMFVEYVARFHEALSKETPRERKLNLQMFLGGEDGPGFEEEESEDDKLDCDEACERLFQKLRSDPQSMTCEDFCFLEDYRLPGDIEVICDAHIETCLACHKDEETTFFEINPDVDPYDEDD